MPGRSRTALTVVLSFALALVATVGLSSTATAKPRTADPATAAVTGTLADGTGAVTGTFDVERFAQQDGQLAAVGTFTGTIEDAAGTLLASGSQQITLPVDSVQQATCEILDLRLGPLDLDLLGLQVHLDEVVLVIEAQPGPGNLLGNLLCAVAGLLDSPQSGLGAVLDQLVRLLNQVLGALG